VNVVKATNGTTPSTPIRLISAAQREVATFAAAGDWHAVMEIAKREAANDPATAAEPPALLGPMLRPALERAKRRVSGDEKAIALPWPSINAHFAGKGLRPGVHYINASTGLGKTQWTLQCSLHAARAGVPVAYIGLELEGMEIALRAMGATALVPWSHLFNGTAGPRYIDAAERAIPSLEGLPFHAVFGDPHGWPVDRLAEVGRSMRAQYPEENGPGSRPILLILDFLQIVGDSLGEHTELRERVGRAAYQCRTLARDLGFVVVVISSIARANYAIADSAGRLLGFDLDENECPIRRRVLNPDALVGIGKESGEIEFSGDSVSVLLRIAETADESGVDVAFATVKGRAVGTTWSPLRFTGFRYDECSDRGARIVEAWKTAADKKASAKQARATAAAAWRAARELADAVAVVGYVLDNPGCSVRSARAAVGDDSKRWTNAKTKIGGGLVTRIDGRTAALSVDADQLPADVAQQLEGRVP